MLNLKNNRINYFITVWSAIALYCYYYLSHGDLPGNYNPQGWWGWFDQGQYLKGARALSQLNFSPENHYYPPLYPFLGSLFVKALPIHPFFFIDGLAFLLFTVTFIKIGTRYCGFWLTLLLYAASVYFNHRIMSTFVVPWSTTCTIAVFSFALLLFITIQDRPDLPMKRLTLSALGLSLAFGLLALARPIDALLASVYFTAFLILSYRNDRRLAIKTRLLRSVALCGVLLIGPVLSAITFLLFNIKVFGSAFGGYFNSTANSSGYFPFELFKKTLSLLSDSYTLYLEPQASLLTHYPWLAFSLAGMVASIWRGDIILKTLCVAIIVHFALYAPYGDLLPNGVWRYNNIHYFKWMIPFLALFAWLSVYWIFEKRHEGPALTGLNTAVVAIIVIMVFSVAFATRQWETQSEITSPSTLQISIEDHPLDFIDIKGVTGNFGDIYFGKHQLWLDGHFLNVVKDYRVLPAPEGVRILFNQTHLGKEVKIHFDPHLTIQPKNIARFGNYNIRLKAPRIRHD